MKCKCVAESLNSVQQNLMVLLNPGWETAGLLFLGCLNFPSVYAPVTLFGIFVILLILASFSCI